MSFQREAFCIALALVAAAPICSAHAESGAALRVANAASVDAILNGCSRALASKAGDTAACPDVTTWRLRDLRSETIDSVLRGIERLDARPVDVKSAMAVIGLRASGQGAALRRVDATAAPVFSLTMEYLAAYLSDASRAGARILVDADTYWAPSVNASAVVIVRQSGILEVLTHGDTDG